jgi:HEAT repeat protein
MESRVAIRHGTARQRRYRKMHIAKRSSALSCAADKLAMLALSLFVSAHVLQQARADVFELAGGGRIEGKLVQSDDVNKSAYTIDLAAGGRVTIPRSQVTKIDNQSAAEVEYQNLARTSPDTADGHWTLAEWCREHKLSDARRRHLERIVELEPNHAAARNALGFHQKNGQWMNRDDVMASRGLVLYEGRYLAPQQVELLKQQKETRSTHADWLNRIEQLRRSLTGRRQDRAGQAHVEIMAIRDPQAAEAIVAVLRRETDPDIKRLWIEVASNLDHQAATEALVHMSLFDADVEIRHQCLEYLIKSRRPGLAAPYIRALKDKDNEIINRAGAALGQIGDRDAIAPLIDALITRHKIKVSEATPDNYTFSKDSSAFSFGGKQGPQFVVQPMRNPAVLDSLVTLSGGASFDYDQSQWRGWLAAQSKATAVDVRRDK